MIAGRARWVGVVTPHARQRYVERIKHPDKFAHLLSKCRRPSCQECVSQAIQLRNISQMSGKYIDIEIRDRIAYAQASESRINNPSFLEIIQKTYSRGRDFEFWAYKSAVFVIVNPPDEPSPVLLTVMSADMIDGMVIQASKTEELSTYFDRWKREARQINHDREIKRL